MNQTPVPTSGAVPVDSEEESRYQETQRLDPIRPADVGALLDRLADPSWRVRMAAVERLATLPDPAPVLPKLLEILATGRGPGARNAAAAVLTRLKTGAVEPLLERLHSSTPEVRGAVAEVLGEIGDRRSAPLLAERMDDPDPNVRSSAAEALGKVGGAEAVQALMQTVAKGPQAPRLAALDALERLRVALPVALLGELVGDRALRRPIYRLLGLSDEPAGYAILASGAFETLRTCREAALAAIGQQCMRRPRAALEPLADAVRAVVDRPHAATITATMLGSDDLNVAAGAVRVLGWLADKRFAPQVALTAEVEDLRPMVLEALQDMGPGLHQIIAETLPELSPAARIAIISTLARCGDGTVFEELVEALDLDDEAARAAAIDGLACLGDLRAAPLLTALLNHADESVASSAAAALGSIASLGEAERNRVLECCRLAAHHPPAALVRLLGLLGDANDVVLLGASLRQPVAATRAAAIAGLQALSARGPVPGLLPMLLEALEDPAPVVRAGAAQAIGSLARSKFPGATALLSSEEVVRELAAGLHDEDSVVQATAAQALGSCRLTQYADALAEVAVAPRSTPEVAAAAIRALAEFGRVDPAILSQAIRHPDPEVVKEVIWAAVGIPGEAGSELLVTAAGHARWDVRRAAAQAIAARGDPSLLETIQRIGAMEEDPMAAEAFADAIRVLTSR